MDPIKNNIFDFSINQTSYFRIKKTIFFNIVNFKEIRKLILSLIDLNKESELKIFISSDSDEFSLKFLEQIINTFSKEDKIKVFLTKQQEHISFSLFSFIAKKIKFDYSFYVSTNNFRQEVNFSIFDHNFNFIKNDVFAKLQNIFLNKIFTEIENNINKQSTFTIVKRKKIEEEYINKMIEEFYFWKKETKLLSIGFLNSNSDVKKFQEKLIGRLDFKFIYSKMSFFKLKWLNLVYFSFFKKPDLLVDLDDEKEKVTFYVKEMKKYRKLNNYELFFLITHFLNKKLKKYKIKLNTELDMVFNLETVLKRLENNYSEKEMILFFKNDLSLFFEKENIFMIFLSLK
ncbi:hypothetical protein NX772_02405 [Mesomycoplasma molare]|uniref:Uncharacterized protein n=1 Tax=Mesomycoplasma molare TaxID=171288 RepID=A0ABY5TUL2_9BACT|nr:hypothetical protein [Mesomycoplasma molare]UWD33940.1 hypothetical protein NX772_02405 [Mesomycoplasma molare]